ncbi:hypothetical protein [Homoserinibacter gongjuensis]|uniref:(d)CMP kinase n=1 Tax=Homoserinibacter gongjuensis TaxID=1162968 RepID=A0ABQ6JR81_9MICO|nr:hypothetical protein [Homoserinibacter gongjuensis]GMA89644.1 hypothetical protein GCM10025869_01730 [Homoserinibacter gongjuensis]
MSGAESTDAAPTPEYDPAPLAARLASGPHPWVLLIDGRSGAGKTVLARDLARLTGATLVSLDEVYPGWDGLAAGAAAVPGIIRDGGWRRWDWAADRPGRRHPSTVTARSSSRDAVRSPAPHARSPITPGGSSATPPSARPAHSHATVTPTRRTGSAGPPRRRRSPPPKAPANSPSWCSDPVPARDEEPALPGGHEFVIRARHEEPARGVDDRGISMGVVEETPPIETLFSTV